MAHRTVHRITCLVSLLAVTSSAKDQSRWSRQISSYTSDISDWVPLSGPVERESTQTPQIRRQAVAEPRILSEPFPPVPRPSGFAQDNLPQRNYFNSPANRQLYLQSVPAVPSAPQNYLTEQGFGQSIRFGLSQPNFPLTQGFVAPPLTFESAPPPVPPKPRTQIVPPNPVQFSQQNLPLSSQAKPFNQAPKAKPETPKLIDGYRAENVSNFGFNKKSPQSLQKIKFDNADKPPRTETIPQNTKVEREEVQLLYVPLESLNRGQFNFRSPISSPQLLNSELYSQGLPKPGPAKQTFLNEYQRAPSNQVDNYSSQNYFSNFNTQVKQDQPQFSTITSPFPTQAPTTLRPKKLKPHQPPLAIFMTKETAKVNQVKVGDVLTSLKNVDTIAVLDSVNPLNAPKVFIGPSSLPPPENYVKFELPYLSNIENSEKKLKQLPFFVAPLSYHTPQGFAKIPFPSPHVGSVVINSQIRESTPAPSTQPSLLQNPYKPTAPTYVPEHRTPQKASFSFFSTAAPNVQPLSNYQSNYYSIEPQTVSSVRPPKQPEPNTPPPKTGSYFLSNSGSQYNSNQYFNFPRQQSFKSSEAINPTPAAYYTTRKPTTTSSYRTTTTTTTTTTRAPSTYSSQLLETHNPYSINQAFHFSTPLDYNNYFEDAKQPYVSSSTSGTSPPAPTSPPVVSSTTSRHEDVVTEKQNYHIQSTPVYLQNYTPEIHYDSKDQNQNWRYPVFNPNDYIKKAEPPVQQTQQSNPVNSEIEPTDGSYNTEYNQNVETQSPVVQENTEEGQLQQLSEEIPINNAEVSKYENNYEYEESSPTSAATISTTTTTRRSPLRGRGRPRYTTAHPESYESSTRTVVTRRPLRERKPLPTRPRYEPNKITTEKPYKVSIDSNESTTSKYTRSRTRGRIHYKPTENDEIYDRRTNTQKKEQDLAYQRDVLHQNYPVTLMERMSTVDIEAITEPATKAPSVYEEPLTETSDTENAYTNERVAISQQNVDTELKEQPSYQTFTSRTAQSENSYVTKSPAAHNEEYLFYPRSSVAPVEQTSYQELTEQEVEDIYVKPTVPDQKLDKAESNAFVTTENIADTDNSEQNIPNYSVSNEYSTTKQEETTTAPEVEPVNQESFENEEEVENVVQTTPSYNRVRVRPGVIRQYHQASSTESAKTKERRRLGVTYRPAFDKRRTTMRIEEIEADLKTKQVHSRPDSQERRHPVYKPDPTTQASVTTAASETSSKRGQFRRRRPSYSYTPTSTEASGTTKRIYDIKNRFRGRRPTDKTTEKPDAQTESPTSTAKNLIHSRYSHRPKLSERYSKKPEPQPEVEDQDSNFSFNRPKYAEPDQGWSPKVNSESFKPYNPNNIVEDQKTDTTELKSVKDGELDIITAKNEYDDVLISVTPASNRLNKKIADIPPTLEAYVEQSKITKADSNDNMSTFESMLEEVMKSLEEQDEDEYTKNVMKHKGGEIGEIPPEKIISSGDNYLQKTTAVSEQEITTMEPTIDDSTLHNEEEQDRKTRRRGFWKKVKVRPVTTESIEFAESQYYTNTVNRLGQSLSKNGHEKSVKKDRLKVTTYKPNFQFIKDLFDADENPANVDNPVDVPKLNKEEAEESLVNEESQHTTVYLAKEAQTDRSISPGDLDLGTGSPDPTLDDLYTTEATVTKATMSDRGDGFSFMDYLFGITSEDSDKHVEIKKLNKTASEPDAEIKITTDQPTSKLVTTETSFIPEEITTEENVESNPEFSDIKKLVEVRDDDKTKAVTEISIVKVETSSVSSFMSPANVVSTSMSTEVSHETEICFRGKCIKTSRDIL